MAVEQPTERLRITPRSAVIAVGLFGLTLAAVRMVMASQRVIGWILAAAVIAGLLHPPIERLSRRIPRGLAVAAVVLAALASVGGIAYLVVDDIVGETRNLQQAAPRRARQLEHSERFGETARELKLEERTSRLVDEAPQRLRGGTPAEALRSAATRGVAFLATGVLSLFFLLHGPRIARAGVRQIHDVRRQATVERVALAAYHRAFGYALGTIAMSVVAGVMAYALARVSDVPGPAPLALWAGLWDTVPILGAVIGTLPIVALAAFNSPQHAIVLACVFLLYQVLEGLLFQRRLEHRTIKVGPFITVAAGFAGLEAYGLGGGLVVLLGVALALAAADELAPE